jgi:hypothetical protein
MDSVGDGERLSGEGSRMGVIGSSGGCGCLLRLCGCGDVGSKLRSSELKFARATFLVRPGTTHVRN